MISSFFLLAILILLNAVFASAEIAVISMNETKLKMLTEQGNKKAVKLTKLTRQPARFLATIQVAITLAGFLSSAFAADYFAQPLVDTLLQAGVPIAVCYCHYHCSILFQPGFRRTGTETNCYEKGRNSGLIPGGDSVYGF